VIRGRVAFRSLPLCPLQSVSIFESTVECLPTHRVRLVSGLVRVGLLERGHGLFQLPGDTAQQLHYPTYARSENYRLGIAKDSETRGKSIGDGDGIMCHLQEQRGGEEGAVHVWKLLIGCRGDAHFRVPSATWHTPPRACPALR